MKVNKIEKTAESNVKISNVIVPRFTVLPDKICTKTTHKKQEELSKTIRKIKQITVQ